MTGKRINFIKYNKKWTMEMYIKPEDWAEYCILYGPMGTRKNCEKLASNQESDVAITWGGWPSFEEYKNLGDKPPEPVKDYNQTPMEPTCYTINEKATTQNLARLLRGKEARQTP